MKMKLFQPQLAALLVAVMPAAPAQHQLAAAIDHGSECTYFGARHKEFSSTGLNTAASHIDRFSPAGVLTRDVTQRMSYAKTLPLKSAAAATSTNTIDKFLFAAMQDAGVTPAEKTNDFEFIRRVSLDLTGRVPTPDRLLQFVNDGSPDKRAKLIDELIAKSEWADKWTMFFGDLFKNNSRNTQVTRYSQGRDAFNKWIKDSLTANKPYDQMARELISARGANSWEQGELNWIVGGFMGGGPVQDTWDLQASNTAETFLGLANANCLECHNGRGHLDNLNLWAKNTTRMDMWGLSAFFSQANLQRVPSAANPKQYYYSVVPDPKRYPGVYSLNTTNGNRPNRAPVGSVRSVMPKYPFNGDTPGQSDNYQQFLAKEVTSDFQFARAAVNYIWKDFFGRGIVEPANQFDLARLDPDNPPPDPWTLQPSNPRLLNALAQDFIDSKFDLKALMREIANSNAYQLSSRYDNSQWTPAMEPLFARKLVRRLMAEEIHDNIAQTSNMLPNYKVEDFGNTNWAMQLPEPANIPLPSAQFLDSFMRGNRDDVQRSGQGSVPQALNLMNDPFVMARIKAVGTGANASLLAQNLKQPDETLITNLFLTVLSRYPTDDEKAAALAKLQSGNRNAQAEDLLWSLYNKVDFIYNY